MAFYKKCLCGCGCFEKAEEFVMSPKIFLCREGRDEYLYPVDGWYWFDTEEEMMVAFDIACME